MTARARYKIEALRYAVRLRIAGLAWADIAPRVAARKGDLLRRACHRHQRKLDLAKHGFGFAVAAQNWAQHRIGMGDPEPSAAVCIYMDRAAALVAKRQAEMAAGVVATVLPLDAEARRRGLFRWLGDSPATPLPSLFAPQLPEVMTA